MTATRPPLFVIHLLAVSVLLLCVKPVLMVGMLAGIIFAWLASVIVTPNFRSFESRHAVDQQLIGCRRF